MSNSSVNWSLYVQQMALPGGGESGNSKSLLSIGLSVNPFGNAEKSTVPKAYLQYILTAKDNSVTRSERKLLSVGANTCEPLSLSYKADTDGYLQVLVANESDQPVCFDDLHIPYQQAQTVKQNHCFF
ncbi:MAG TPA: hypothetical protein VF646_05255 [Cytophagales bacterium]